MSADLAEQLEDRGIYVKVARGTQRGACPKCDRGPKDDALAVTIDEGGAVWTCHRCGFKGAVGSKPNSKANGSAGHTQEKNTTLADWGRAIWDKAIPITAGSKAAIYLESRGCAIPPDGTALRWHPQHPHKKANYTGPCLIALVTNIETGEMQSLHRTWLAQDGSGKAPIDTPRMYLANHETAGGVVRLGTNKGLLAVGEGLESCMHWAKATGGAAWAALDAGNLAKFPVLEGLTRLTVLADHDKPNPKTGIRAGTAAARAVLRRYGDTEVDLRVVFAPTEGHDAADLRADEIPHATMTGERFLAEHPATTTPPLDSEAMNLAELEFLQPPDRVWIWDGWIIKGRAHYMNGPGGVGKTLLCQQIGTAIGLGRELFGVQTLQGPVVGIWGEDNHDEMWRRQVAINRRFNCSMHDLHDAGVCWIPTARDITMFTAGVESDFAVTEEFEKFKEMIERRKPALAIIDGVTLVYEGPEGKRALVTRVMRAFDEVAQKSGCAIVIIGHNNKEGEFSGSTAFENAVRARMSLERIETEDGGDALRLSLPKANYNGKQKIEMRFSNGSLSAIDDEHMDNAAKLDRDLRRGACDQKFLDGVDLLTLRGITMSVSRQAGNYAPRLIHPENMPHDFGVKEMEAAMLRLIKAGRLEPRAVLPFKKNRRWCEGLGRPCPATASGVDMDTAEDVKQQDGDAA